jgi:hypothetical protein
MQPPYQKRKSLLSLHLAARDFFPMEPEIPIVRTGDSAAALHLQKNAISQYK